MEWAPIIAVLAVLAMLVVCRWPVEASLGTYAFLLPFDSVLIAGYTGRIHLHTTWFVGIGAACVLSTTGLLSRGFLRPPRPALWLAVFVLWTGISFWWALDPKSATFRLPVVALLLLIYLAGVCTPVTGKELATVSWLSILGACVAAAISLYQFSQGQYYVPQGVDDLDEVITGRGSLWIGGVDTDPNILAASLILPLSLASGLLLSAHAWLTRLLMAGSIILIGSCICLTMSRGAVIASITLLLIYLLRSRAKWRLLLPIALLAAVICAMPNLFFSRITESTEDQGAGRVGIWKVGLEGFKEYGLIGVGLDCFPHAYDKYAYVAFDFKGYSKGPHNAYLGVGVELGVVGLILLAILVRGHLHLAAKVSRNTDDDSSHLRLVSYEAGCWGLLICGFFLDILWEEYLWLSLMLLVMSSQARKPTRETGELRAESINRRMSFTENVPLPLRNCWQKLN